MKNQEYLTEMSTGNGGHSSSSSSSGARMAGSWRNNRWPKRQAKWQIGGAGMMVAMLLAAVLVLAEFGERNAVNGEFREVFLFFVVVAPAGWRCVLEEKEDGLKV